MPNIAKFAWWGKMEGGDMSHVRAFDTPLAGIFLDRRSNNMTYQNLSGVGKAIVADYDELETVDCNSDG